VMAGEPLLPSSLGFGRHAFSNRLGLPLVELERGQVWRDPSGQSYLLPRNSTIDTTTAKASIKTHVWPTMKSYLSSHVDWTQSPTVTLSPLTEMHSNYDSLLTNYFGAMSSILQATYLEPRFTVSIPADVLSRAKLLGPVEVAFSILAKAAYPERKDLFFSFLNRVGTSFVWKSICGGLIERTSDDKRDSQLGVGVGISSDNAKQNLEINFFPGHGKAEWKDVVDSVIPHKGWVRQACLGGHSGEIDCLTVASVDAWKAQLWANPVPVIDAVLPITRLVKDTALQAKMAKALVDYIAQEKLRFQKMV